MYYFWICLKIGIARNTLHHGDDKRTCTKRDMEEGSPAYVAEPLVSRTQESDMSRMVNSEFV